MASLKTIGIGFCGMVLPGCALAASVLDVRPGGDGAGTAGVAEPAAPQPPRLGSAKERSSTSTRTLRGTGRAVGPFDLTNSWIFARGNKGDVSTGYVFQDIRMNNSCLLYSATQAGAELSASTFRRIDAQNVCAKGLLRFRGVANDMLIEDVSIKVTGVNTSPGTVPAGIAFAGKLPADSGHNITFRRVYVSGVRSEHGRFLNGDGIATESKYGNVRYEDVTVEHNIDAGIDNKATPVTCARVKSGYNRRNFKFWYGVDCDGPVISEEPGQAGSGQSAHMQLFGRSDGSSIFHFSQMLFRSSNKTPLIVNGTPKNRMTVVIDRCIKQVPADTPVKWDPYNMITLKLGPGC